MSAKKDCDQEDLCWPSTLGPRHWLPTQMTQCWMDEAMSEASWAAPAKEKARDWWSIELEGEVEELELGCPWTVTKGDSMDPEGEMNHQSDGKKAAIQEHENFGNLRTMNGRRATSRECRN